MFARRLTCFFWLTLAAVATSARASERSQKWIEVRSPHFIVASNSGEKQARRVAKQFELIRAVFESSFSQKGLNVGLPVIVLAAKDEATLKALLPAYWEKKGHVHPAGLFVSGPEKHFVALSLDVQGTNPYETIYHEYVHVLSNQALSWVPTWLTEGLAEFYASTRMGDKEVFVGAPSDSNLEVLRENSLLPLEVLLAVDHSSPYYNEENKASIFYAQSWALTHYLMLRDWKEGTRRLQAFVGLVSRDVNQVNALRQVYGEPTAIEEALRAYIGQFSFLAVRLQAPAEIDEKEFAVRELSPVESAAFRGDFLVHQRRYREGRALLEEALQQDRNFAPAHESMGLLEFEQRHEQEATKWFTEAVKLNSQSYLAHYYYAVMTMQKAQSADTSAQVETSLRTAIKINPTFAPAYDALATYYGMQGKNLDEAHMLSLRASQLDPSSVPYVLTGASILLRMNRADDAVRVSERALRLAKSAEDRTAAQSFLTTARQYQEAVAGQKQALAMAEEQQGQHAETVKAGQQATLPARESTPPSEPPANAGGLRASVEGTIVEIHCKPPAALRLTLALRSYELVLHARDFHQVLFRGGDFKFANTFDPCKDFNRMKVSVVYSVGAQDAGEIISIELKK